MSEAHVRHQQQVPQAGGLALSLPEADEGRAIAHFRGRLLLGAALLVGALVYFAYTAFEGSTVYYYTVGELVQQGAALQGKAVRVSGKLVPASFKREPGSTLATFAITDGSTLMPSAYEGVVPDLFFNEHSDIVLHGTYRGDGTFHAENVIVKCPSKYVAVTR